MATQRRYSIEFKRQVVQEYQSGETLHGLAKRHGISRNLVRIWAAKAEAGEFDDDLCGREHPAGIRSAHRRARTPGRQVAQERVSKGGFVHVRRATSATTSVIAGLVVLVAEGCAADGAARST